MDLLRKLIVCLTFLGFTFAAVAMDLPFTQNEVKADNAYDEAYNTIASVKLTELGTREVSPAEQKLDLNEVIMVVDQLIAIGKKVWPLIEAGRPVITSTFDPISVLPKLVREDNGALYQMYGWSTPKASHYKVEYENLFGITVVSFEFAVHYQYNGTLNGKGRYLTSVDVVPNTIHVLWGFTFDATANLVSISNRGTAEEPVAGATITVAHKVSNVLNEIQSKVNFHMTGSGELTSLDID